MRVYKLTIDSPTSSPFCAIKESDAGNLLDNLKESGVGDKYCIEIIEMTDEEYDNLGDFEGF